MARDINAPAEPHIVVGPGVIDKAFQGGEPAGPSGDPAMQTDRHHPGRLRAFLMERIETVLQIIEELVARVEDEYNQEDKLLYFPPLWL